jgi:hypothetical protein
MSLVFKFLGGFLKALKTFIYAWCFFVFMAKLLNAVFGIGVAVVVYVLILLGIQAFYPEVRFDDFCNSTVASAPVSGFEKCFDNMTVGECRSLTDLKKNDEFEKCNNAFMDADKQHNKVFFIIASSLGALVVLVSFFLISWLGMANISAGIACAGIVLIMYAFVRGWVSIDDRIKFGVGIVVAALIIFLAVKVNKMLEKS